MSNKCYNKNNYEEFYNDWNDSNNCCSNDCDSNDYCSNDYRSNDYRSNNYRSNNRDDSCIQETLNFQRRPIRRCDEDAIEREINRLFKFILNNLCNVEQDIDVISRAFVRLAELLVEDTCLEESEKDLICCVAQDLKALQVLIDKTIRDTKCLKKDVKCC